MTRPTRSRPEDRLAQVVLDQCLAVRRGETLTVETWDHALPWARAFVLEARRRGCEPTLVVEDEAAFFRSLAQSGSRTVPSAPAAIAEASDAYVYFPGPEHFPRLLGLSAEELDAVLGRHGAGWWRAARRAGLRAARIAVAAATAPAAARFGVDRDAWQRELVQGSLVAPDRLARAAGRLVRRLHRARQVHLHHPNGTDLTVEVLRAPPVVEDGRVDRADRRAAGCGLRSRRGWWRFRSFPGSPTAFGSRIEKPTTASQTLRSRWALDFRSDTVDLPSIRSTEAVRRSRASTPGEDGVVRSPGH